MRDTRRVSWIKAARKVFENFPGDVQSDMLAALTVAAEGSKSIKQSLLLASKAAYLKLPCAIGGDAFRSIYALNIDDGIWVLHAFQKKSKSGIKTPQIEVDLIRDRLKRLKEMLR